MFRDELDEFLNTYLKINEFSDPGPNGLQVSGKEEIQRIVTGVTASVELFEKAVSFKADTIIVHHGIIWDFQRPRYIGSYRERVRILLENNLNLFAYHLPLDAHPEVGNNAQIARALHLQHTRPFGDYKGHEIGVRGQMSPKKTINSFSRVVAEIMQHKPLIFPYGPDRISSVGIVSGGSDKNIHQAVEAGLDVFITGEVSEHIMHYAQEEKIHFIAAGHYATERFGVQALAMLINNKFNIPTQFIDIPNPV